jgi:hypothetical protein
MYPCQRFAAALAGVNAWLGAVVAGYAFDVQKSHLLPPAGFPGARRMLDASSSPSASPSATNILRAISGLLKAQ